MNRPTPILLAAFGNRACGDDAFGSLVAAEVLRLGPVGVDVLDVGTDATSMLDALPGRRLLIIVDAADLPGSPVGSLIDCDWSSPQRPALIGEQSISTHGLSLPAIMQLAAALGLLPDFVRLIAAAAGSCQLGEDMAPPMQAAVPQAARRIGDLARSLIGPGQDSTQWDQSRTSHGISPGSRPGCLPVSDE